MPSLRTLGGIELTGGEESILPRRRKELVLLAYLLRRAPRPVPRQELATLLWGDRDESRARHSLRQALSELRAEVGDILEITPESVCLLSDRMRLDIREFERAIEVEHLEEAAEWWRGEFLEGCEDLGTEELRTWIEQERAGLRKQLDWVYRRLLERVRGSGDAQAAIAVVNRWCAALPYDEDAHRNAVEILQIAGRTAESAARHATFVARLRADLGIIPSDRFMRLGSAPASSEPVHLGERGLLTPDLVGRTEALGRLEQAWRTAFGGGGAVVLIVGDEGMGKGRLGREFIRFVRARTPASLVVEARAFSTERDRPWALVRPLLTALSKAPGVRAAPAPVLARVADLVPEIRERMPLLPPASPETSPVESVVRVLLEVAAEAPLLLFIDDATSADAMSLEVLGALVRRPPPGCMLILASRSDALAASPLDQDLHQATPHVTRLDLGPLQTGEIELMIASMLPLATGVARPLSVELLRASSGNPGQVEQLIFAWVDAGVLALGPDGRWTVTRPLEGAPLPVPPDLRAAIAARIGRLGSDARRAAEAAAILESEIEPGLLREISGLPADRIGAALGEVLSHRILRESPRRPGTYEFPGEPTRLAVYDALPPARRRTLHRRAATAIRRLPANTPARSERVRHHERLGQTSQLRRRTVILAAAIASIIVAVGWALLRRGETDVGQGGQIVLADVENTTPDSALGRAFYAAATVGLSGSRYLSLFPRSRVRETFSRMGRRGADSALSEGGAREVAVREGLAMVVALAVTQVDTSFLLSSRLIDPESGRDLYATSARVAGKAGLLDGIDQLLSRTRAALGESARELRANAEPLPRITTSSLDALRAFVAGGEAWARRDERSAQSHWARAIALDSSFALALAAMADLWYLAYNNRSEGDRWMNMALAKMDRLTERERFRIFSQAAQRQGRPVEAVDYAQMLAERYPARDTWFNHGTVLLGQSRCKEAIPSFRKSISYDSLFTNGYLNLATCLQLEGPPEAALAAYAAAGRSDTLALYRANINHEWGVAFVRAGRPAEAETAYRRMAETGGALDRARGLRSLAWLAIYQGKFQQAVQHLADALKLSSTGNVPVSVLRNQVILAEALIMMGDSARARRVVDSATVLAKEIDPDPAFLLYLGRAQLRAGRTSAAKTSLGTVKRKVIPTSAYDNAVRQGLEAHVLLGEGKANEAVAAAAQAHDPRQAAYRLAALAQAYAAARNLDSALAVSARLSNTFAFGEESQFEWLRGPLLVARYAEAKGDSATARAAYGRFISQWAAGDSTLPDLVRARKALARLQAVNRE